MSLTQRIFRIVKAEMATLFPNYSSSNDAYLDDYRSDDALDEPDLAFEPDGTTARAPSPQAFIKGDYYLILGVPYTASQRQIRRAYHDLAKQYHPDKHNQGTPTDAQRARERMNLINEAYHHLKDSERRAQYNLTYSPQR